MGGEDSQPELYTRWLQYGMLSPVLRTHTSKDARKERRIYEYAEPYKSTMIHTLRRRYELVPYIYATMRKTEESGISLCRPMYYDHPKESQAYQYTSQYMFGDQMLVAPIVEPADAQSNLAQAKIWLPEGQWIDTATGQTHQGGQVINMSYLLGEVPIFVRPGAILCCQSDATRLKEGSYEHLLFEIYAGATGETVHYEDDGISLDYQNGKSMSMEASYRESADALTLILAAAKGTFDGFKAKRNITIKFFMSSPPSSVSIDGIDTEWSFRGGENTWHYLGDQTCVVVECSTLDVTKQHAITLSNPLVSQQDLIGFHGWMNGLESVRLLNCLVSPCHPLIAEERFAVNLAQTGNRISRNPQRIKEELLSFYHGLPTLPEILERYQNEYAKKEGDINSDSSAQVAHLKKARAILKALNERA